MRYSSFFEINGVGTQFPCNEADIWSDWIAYNTSYTQFSLDSNNNVLYNGLKLIKNNAPVKSSDLVDQGSYDRDLSGTIWCLYDTPSILGDTYYINFLSNSNNYNQISSSGKRLKYNTTTVWDEGWSNDAFRIISITDGTDATNATLIAWLESNAVQVPVADLTGTTWVINDSDLEAYDGSFYISFTSNELMFDNFVLSALASFRIEYDSIRVYNSDSGWALNAYKTISIIDGTDVTNLDLIVWLSNNATYQEPTPQPSHINKIGDLPIIKKKFGNLTVVKEVINGVTIYEDNPPVQLISFTIQGVIYQAVDGMTWGEWINSAYNTDNYTEYGDFISGEYDGVWVVYNHNQVRSSDLIVADCVCTLSYSG